MNEYEYSNSESLDRNIATQSWTLLKAGRIICRNFSVIKVLLIEKSYIFLQYNIS